LWSAKREGTDQHGGTEQHGVNSPGTGVRNGNGTIGAALLLNHTVDHDGSQRPRSGKPQLQSLLFNVLQSIMMEFNGSGKPQRQQQRRQHATAAAETP
jgi:hypothetical protein